MVYCNKSSLIRKSRLLSNNSYFHQILVTWAKPLSSQTQEIPPQRSLTYTHPLQSNSKPCTSSHPPNSQPLPSNNSHPQPKKSLQHAAHTCSEKLPPTLTSYKPPTSPNKISSRQTTRATKSTKPNSLNTIPTTKSKAITTISFSLPRFNSVALGLSSINSHANRNKWFCSKSRSKTISFSAKTMTITMALKAGLQRMRRTRNCRFRESSSCKRCSSPRSTPTLSRRPSRRQLWTTSNIWCSSHRASWDGVVAVTLLRLRWGQRSWLGQAARSRTQWACAWTTVAALISCHQWLSPATSIIHNNSAPPTPTTTAVPQPIRRIKPPKTANLGRTAV